MKYFNKPIFPFLYGQTKEKKNCIRTPDFAKNPLSIKKLCITDLSVDSKIRSFCGKNVKLCSGITMLPLRIGRIYILDSREPPKQLTDFLSHTVRLQIIIGGDDRVAPPTAAGEESSRASKRHRTGRN